MHEVEVKGILSAKNGMNIYRGCTHGCIYCDSRSKCYQMKHDFEDIERAVNNAKACKDKPTAIICKTIKGKGVSFMEDNVSWHGSAPNEEQFNAGLCDIEAYLKGLEG